MLRMALQNFYTVLADWKTFQCFLSHTGMKKGSEEYVPVLLGNKRKHFQYKSHCIIDCNGLWIRPQTTLLLRLGSIPSELQSLVHSFSMFNSQLSPKAAFTRENSRINFSRLVGYFHIWVLQLPQKWPNPLSCMRIKYTAFTQGFSWGIIYFSLICKFSKLCSQYVGEGRFNTLCFSIIYSYFGAHVLIVQITFLRYMKLRADGVYSPLTYSFVNPDFSGVNRDLSCSRMLEIVTFPSSLLIKGTLMLLTY